MTSVGRQETEGQVLFCDFKKISVYIDVDCELIFRRALFVEFFAGLTTHLSRKDYHFILPGSLKLD